jgi:hypothetical protein
MSNGQVRKGNKEIKNINDAIEVLCGLPDDWNLAKHQTGWKLNVGDSVLFFDSEEELIGAVN